MRAVIVAVLSGILLLASWENVANARVSAGGVHTVAPGHPGLRFNRTFRRWPLYGGYLAVPAYPADGFLGYPPYPPFPPNGSATDYPGDAPAQRCENPTQRTVTVRAEAGGTKDVTVTYCHP